MDSIYLKRESKDISIQQEVILNVFITYLVTQIVFWTVGGLTIILDVTGKPKWMMKNKIQPGKNQPLKNPVLWKIVRVAIRNQLLIGFPLTAIYYPLQKWRGCEVTVTFPGFWNIIRDLFFSVIIEEICFYYSHRLLHHPWLYKSIHKIHHEWTAPIGIAAVYCHPMEYIFSNIIPLMLGPLICGSSLVTVWIWFTLATAATISHHSGYHIPYFPGNDFHDYHHLKFNDNFGVLGFLDWLHGTDKRFRIYKQSRQH